MNGQSDSRREEVKNLLRSDRNVSALAHLDSTNLIDDGLFRLAALQGAGDLKRAWDVAGSIDALLAVSAFPHPELAHAMMGNLLVTEGRVAEALDRYEKAIRPGEQHPDGHNRLFASIWRELALAHFGDLGTVTRLEKLAQSAREIHETHLGRLASAFSLVACAIVKQLMAPDRIQTLLDAMDHSTPGLTASAYMAASLCGWEEVTGTPRNLDQIIEWTVQCEGIKGEAEIFRWYQQRFADAIALHPQGPAFLEWIRRYVDPVMVSREAFAATLFAELPDEPLLHPMNCAHCDGRCCYDGVYITTEEEARFRDFMKQYPQYFGHVPENFTEDGEWGFLFHGKRTIRVPHRFTRPDFPSHFTQTKCVFADSTGECALQKAATENGYHPWRYKPASCWEFPMIGLFNDDAMKRPHYFGVPDPGYCDEDHPGYVSFMPCAAVFPAGVSWKKVYQNEIQYFLFLRSQQK